MSAKYVIALDRNQNRVHISQAESGGGYICPFCGSEMIARKGAVMLHHFAHKSKEECDSWYTNKGEWHRKMQAMFPIQWQEVIIERNGVKHIADVCFDKPNGQKEIIEFQHSPMTFEEFQERSSFYKGTASADLIWVFDITDRDVEEVSNYHHLFNSQIALKWLRPFATLGLKFLEEIPIFFYVAPVDRNGVKQPPFFLFLKGVGENGYGMLYGDKFDDVTAFSSYVDFRRYWYENRDLPWSDGLWLQKLDFERYRRLTQKVYGLLLSKSELLNYQDCGLIDRLAEMCRGLRHVYTDRKLVSKYLESKNHLADTPINVMNKLFHNMEDYCHGSYFGQSYLMWYERAALFVATAWYDKIVPIEQNPNVLSDFEKAVLSIFYRYRDIRDDSIVVSAPSFLTDMKKDFASMR